MPEPRWLTSDSKKNKKMSKRQEKRTAKMYGEALARVTIGSGNKFEKGDVTVAHEKMVECKITSKKQITVKEEWLRKLVVEAYKENKEPIFEFGFNGLSLYDVVEWQAVPKERMVDLMTKEKELEKILQNK